VNLTELVLGADNQITDWSPVAHVPIINGQPNNLSN